MVETENEAEAYTPPVLEREIDRPYVSTRDTAVDLDDSLYALVPATAVVTDDHNTTHIGMLRFGDCDTRVISEDNAKTSYKRKNPNLTQIRFYRKVQQ